MCTRWTSYNKTSYNKIKVAFNNIARQLLGYDSRDSASHIFVIDNFHESGFEKKYVQFKCVSKHPTTVLLK